MPTLGNSCTNARELKLTWSDWQVPTTYWPANAGVVERHREAPSSARRAQGSRRSSAGYAWSALLSHEAARVRRGSKSITKGSRRGRREPRPRRGKKTAFSSSTGLYSSTPILRSESPANAVARFSATRWAIKYVPGPPSAAGRWSIAQFPEINPGLACQQITGLRDRGPACKRAAHGPQRRLAQRTPDAGQRHLRAARRLARGARRSLWLPRAARRHRRGDRGTAERGVSVVS